MGPAGVGGEHSGHRGPGEVEVEIFRGQRAFRRSSTKRLPMVEGRFRQGEAETSPTGGVCTGHKLGAH